MLGRHPRRERSDRPGIRYIEMMPADAHPCGDDCQGEPFATVRACLKNIGLAGFPASLSLYTSAIVRQYRRY